MTNITYIWAVSVLVIYTKWQNSTIQSILVKTWIVFTKKYELRTTQCMMKLHEFFISKSETVLKPWLKNKLMFLSSKNDRCLTRKYWQSLSSTCNVSSNIICKLLYIICERHLSSLSFLLGLHFENISIYCKKKTNNNKDNTI